ncbi:MULTISPECIES: Asp23/Gls24 family envelope stress response protein [unclassified Streptomyces]|uniref:Asp23/Gls24 family envelope stress response protein n=1 Tax=unclassified Streptomyces TaxID=2593676 RepID=UPI00226F9CB8|nr:MULTISPECIES: Asp23/Gls24 family envelope stress response protein [unclassified Streptomyces]MCY0916949.1 Asp23/Gls24 family envelope stress response protein [Streptomyces sp. H27-G5]MCY0963264.1 Asp23/Gls24 family envelope stress response protein [Streptomyces sp. H27-H5]
MTDTITRTPPVESVPNGTGKDLRHRTASALPVPESRGRTTIADSVVAQIAGMAAREVPGIHSLGAGMSRAFGAMRDHVPGGGSNLSRGVRVEVGERQAAVDLDVVVEYGVAILDIAATTRAHVIAEVERTTGLDVVEVNISVVDVHLPQEDDDSAPGESRVQ